MKNPQFPLILASSSRYRAELLSRLGLAFVSLSPDLDETPRPAESPRALTERLAYDKAHALLTRHPDAVVIGSDQTAALGAMSLGKPLTVERAVAQLHQLSQQTVVFHTAWTVLSATHCVRGVDDTTVRFKSLSDHQIRRYIELEQPLDCAGSFKSEGLGVVLFESIQSNDPTALIGLPLIAVAKALSQFGLDPLA